MICGIVNKFGLILVCPTWVAKLHLDSSANSLTGEITHCALSPTQIQAMADRTDTRWLSTYLSIYPLTWQSSKIERIDFWCVTMFLKS
jgi:hypothetical protein